LTGTLVDIQARLQPRALLHDAIDELREAGTDLLRKGLSQARANPGPLIGITATVAAYIAREWFITHATPVADDAPGTATLSNSNTAPKLIKAPVKRPPRRKRP
jgi:hypothetical protein